MNYTQKEIAIFRMQDRIKVEQFYIEKEHIGTKSIDDYVNKLFDVYNCVLKIEIGELKLEEYIINGSADKKYMQAYEIKIEYLQEK